MIDSDAHYMLPWSPDPASSGKAQQKLWKDDDGPSFGELLDIINPLQHIPIVSSLYRAITGDEISLGSRLTGGALFGGPLGFVLTGLTAAAEDATGGRIDQHLAALFESDTGAEPGNDAQVLAAIPTIERTRTNIPFSAALTAAVPVPAVPLPAAPAPPQAALRGPPVNPHAEQTTQGFPAMDGNDRRPIQAKLQAQRAQAELLLTRIATQRPEGSDGKPAETRESAARRGAHPFMPPADAGPDWYLRAMERAFRKYRAANRDDGRPPTTTPTAANLEKRAIAVPQPAL